MNTVSSEQPFADIVIDHTARSHDLTWSTRPDGCEVATCLYCGGSAVDQRSTGLPWVRFEGVSLELACEGPTPYRADGTFQGWWPQ
jgi:hypothetical protein